MSKNLTELIQKLVDTISDGTKAGDIESELAERLLSITDLITYEMTKPDAMFEANVIKALAGINNELHTMNRSLNKRK